MGSVETSPDEFTVLVTGFAPFKSEYPQNPSWEIAKELPAYLPALRKAGPSSGEAQAPEPAPELPPVRIVVYPEPVRVNYKVVRDLVPRLWDAQVGDTAGDSDNNSPDNSPDSPSPFPPGFRPPARIDLLLHIGMAGPRLHYAVERIGRRDGYAMPDVDDERLGDTPADHADPAWPWYGVPPALETDLDLDDALPRWRAALPRLDLRISLDAGRYLCDFIYFSSLAHLYRQDRAHQSRDPRYRRRRVAFLHVPASAAPDRLAVGRDVAIELIRALVTAEVVARAKPLSSAAETSTSTAVIDTSVPGADVATGKWYRD